MSDTIGGNPAPPAPGLSFGAVALDDALGAILAHSLLVDGHRWAKGRVLTDADLARARAAGVRQVSVARLAEDDMAEGAAAAALAAALAGPGVAAAAAAHGRANLVAIGDGVVVLDPSTIDAVNAVDEGITVGTLAPHARVAAGEVVATVKIIPFAVAGTALAAAVRATARPDSNAPAPIAIAAFVPRRFVLIQTRLAATADKMLVRTDTVTRARVDALGGILAPGWTECDHAVDALAAILAAQHPGVIILIAGASATADRRDVIPAAIVAAGGTIERLGMPVDPGNLLCLGRLRGCAVIGLPGCARSPKRNGFDWVLERLAAGLDVTSAGIAAMGVGGLLPEAERPQPRVAANRKAPRTAPGRETPGSAAGKSAPRIAAVGAIVLAAGSSSRFGAANKLLADLDGQPVIAHVVAAIAAAGLPPPIVVVGDRAGDVRAGLAGYTVRFIDAADFAAGMSRSLAAGLAAAPADWHAALVCLGDMPRVGVATLRALAAAAADGTIVAAPVRQGRRGNPMLWGRAHWPALMAITGDTGGRALLATLPVVEVDAGSDGIFADVDTPEALATLRGT